MRRSRTIGLVLLALLALGALTAAVASAEEGFLPLTKKGFTDLGKKAILETVSKEKIACAVVTSKGAFTTDSHGTVTFDFDECEVLGFPLFSLGDPKPKTIKEALVLVDKALFLICLIDSAALLFGIFIELTTPVHIEAEALGILLEVTGSLIGHILPKAEVGKKATLWGVDFTQKAGVQTIKECKDEKGVVKTASLKSKKDPEAAVEAGQAVVEGLVQFEESVELMDK
jgi:hypothetical protein